MSRGWPSRFPTGGLVEQAFRAVRRAQQMTPGLRAQARAQSGNPRLNVHIKASGPSQTDGKSIWITPPIELGLPLNHQRNLCHEYEWSGRSRCPACQVFELVQYRLEHEVSHITQGSFERITPEDLDFLVEAAVQAQLERDPSLARLEVLQDCQKKFGWDRDRERYKLEGRDFLELATKFSPWMQPIMRSIEDARVNAGVHEIKPGTRRYFRSYFIEALEGGLMNPDGSVTDYRSLKPDHQVIMASLFVASGYVGDLDLTEFFDPDVVDLLVEDEEINALLNGAPECQNVRDVFTLASRLLPAFQKRGWLPEKKKDEPKPEDQEESEDQPEADQEASQEESEDQPEADQGEPEDQPEADQEASQEEPEDQPEADQEASQEEPEADQEADQEASQGEPEDQPEADQEADQDPGPGEESEDEDDEEEESLGGEEDEGDGTDGDSGGDEEEEGSDDHGGDGEDQGSGDEGDESSSGAEDGSEGGDGWGSSSGDGSEEEQDSSEDSSADPDEQGPGSDPSPGLTEDDPADSAQEAMRLLLQLGGHDAGSIFPEDEDSPEDVDPVYRDDDDDDEEKEDSPPTEEQALKVALNQSDWFSEASQEVGGIHVLNFNDKEGFQNGHHLPGTYRNYEWIDEDRARRQLGADPKTIVGANVSLARLAFTANRAVQHERGLPRGRVHSPTVGRRLLTGDPNAFHRRNVPDEREYAVIVAFDFSGSTEGRVLQQTKESVRACGDLLNRLPGVKFGVFGHTATYVGSGFSAEALGMFIPTIKDFKEPWNGESLRRLASIESCDTEFDGHNIEVYRKMLERQKASHRLLLYYTDGDMPAFNETEETEIIQRECKHFERDPRMAILGVGMGTDSPKQYGLDTVALYSVEDLSKLVSKLRDVLARLGAV